MTTTLEDAKTDVLEIEIAELIAAYRECQMNAKAWEDEKNRVRPVLERKMVERGATVWECEYGKALYQESHGEIDYQRVFVDVLDAYLNAIPADQRKGVEALWLSTLDDYRKPGHTSFIVRPPLKVAPNHDNDDLAPALEASVAALVGKDST